MKPNWQTTASRKRPQTEAYRRPPAASGYSLASKFCFREFKHVRIQIRRDDFGRGRQRVAQLARYDSSATCNFENAIEFRALQTRDQVFRERLENHRTEIAIIIFRDRFREYDVAIALRCT